MIIRDRCGACWLPAVTNQSSGSTTDAGNVCGYSSCTNEASGKESLCRPSRQNSICTGFCNICARMFASICAPLVFSCLFSPFMYAEMEPCKHTSIVCAHQQGWQPRFSPDWAHVFILVLNQHFIFLILTSWSDARRWMSSSLFWLVNKSQNQMDSPSSNIGK